MDKYKRLMSNTFIFALGTFSSKLLVFFMMRFYTGVLSDEAYGMADIIVQTCNLLIPIASVGIINAVIRFGLERGIDKKSVFTTSLVVILLGFCGLLCFSPLLNRLDFLQGYLVYLYCFIFTSSMQGLCSQFVRAKGLVKLYAIDGVYQTVMTVVLNIVLMGPCKLGVPGYLLSTILTDFSSFMLLIWLVRLDKYIDFSKIKASLTKQMLKYSIPMIPNTISTWIINMSSRYLILYMINEGATGIYAVANKIPTLMIIIANIFGDAWQISAVTDSKQTRQQFFSQVADVYQSIAFLMASALIMVTQMVIKILAAPEFFEAWRCMPILVMATTFACLASFLSSVYMVEKRSNYIMATTMIGAAINLGLSFFLIPIFGLNGAAVATFVSYFTMFVIRFIHTQTFIRIRWHGLKLGLNFIMIIAQAYIILNELYLWPLWEILLFGASLALNSKALLLTLNKLGLGRLIRPH